jgi:hypothetical protein
MWVRPAKTNSCHGLPSGRPKLPRIHEHLRGALVSGRAFLNERGGASPIETRGLGRPHADVIKRHFVSHSRNDPLPRRAREATLYYTHGNRPLIDDYIAMTLVGDRNDDAMATTA